MNYQVSCSCSAASAPWSAASLRSSSAKATSPPGAGRRLHSTSASFVSVSIVKWSGLEAEEQVRNAVEEGLKLQFRRPFRYADLPAFDGVRYLGAKKEDYEARPRDTEVLVLCPFDGDYSTNQWPEVQRALRDTWGNKKAPGARSPRDRPAVARARRKSPLRFYPPRC